MRTLLLMRGAPGSGKSTWIKENGLEQYTLEADRFRMLVCNPEINEDGYFCISQKYDSIAWNMLFSCLEERMSRGDFTVIDATHSSSSMINKYRKLANKYRYRVYIKEINIPLEDLIKRDTERPEYKRVPHNAIERIHSLINNTKIPSWVSVIEDISEINDYFIDENLEERYNRIVVIGDIHGCNTALQQLMANGVKEDTLYIFCGDYFDRGIEIKETLEFILEHKNDKNFIFLEGNHEGRIRNWINNDWPTNKKGEVRVPREWKNTKAAFCEGISSKSELANLKKDISEWTRKLRVAYAFSFYGNKYIISHAGISSLPKMTYISARQFINGVGGYDTEIDEKWETSYENGRCRGFTQIHGHRKTESTEHSICLEGGVERGGELVAYSISELETRTVRIKNNIYNTDVQEFSEQNVARGFKKKQDIPLTMNETTNKIIEHPNVNVKMFEELNLMSLNFDRNTFKKGVWDGITNKARGLFVDTTTGDIRLRSYNKFFNFNERPETSKKKLEQNLKFPCSVYRKENGFLGMTSVVEDSMLLATKSVVESGDFYIMFKEIYDTVPQEQRDLLFKLSKENNCTFVFEVCHVNDRHIIDFDKNHLYLLDAVPNSYEFDGENIDGEFSDKILSLIPESDVLTKKVKVCEVSSLEEIEELIRENRHNRELEGYVIRDMNGFLFKIKLHYYNVIKHLRGDLRYAQSNYLGGLKMNRFQDGRTIKFISYFANNIPFEEWKNIHIIDALKEYEKANGDFIARD